LRSRANTALIASGLAASLYTAYYSHSRQRNTTSQRAAAGVSPEQGQNN
jgi:hypothetical protein